MSNMHTLHRLCTVFDYFIFSGIKPKFANLNNSELCAQCCYCKRLQCSVWRLWLDWVGGLRIYIEVEPGDGQRMGRGGTEVTLHLDIGFTNIYLYKHVLCSNVYCFKLQALLAQLTTVPFQNWKFSILMIHTNLVFCHLCMNTFIVTFPLPSKICLSLLLYRESNKII